MPIFKKLKSVFKKPKKTKKAEPSKKKAKPPIVQVKPSRGGKRFKEAYKILKEPHVSEKATVLNEQDKYVFKVYSEANKIETKKAIESLYGVRVKDVNIVNIPRKRKMFRGTEGFKSGYKKAIVTLEKGQKIEILPH
jgi:large subunit ribosomal protein L23